MKSSLRTIRRVINPKENHVKVKNKNALLCIIIYLCAMKQTNQFNDFFKHCVGGQRSIQRPPKLT